MYFFFIVVTGGVILYTLISGLNEDEVKKTGKPLSGLTVVIIVVVVILCWVGCEKLKR